jgi:hypothetical protein
MSNSHKSLNDTAWENLFEKYHILNQIEAHSRFEISASQIKEFREPRLMAKFDHAINLPEIFADNNLVILPISRGDYVISNFDAYHKFELGNAPITKVVLPAYLQSLDPNGITSEAVALNCALATGIIADFLQDEDIVPTVSGRMGSGTFSFNIINLKNYSPCSVQVSNSQIEIDAAYEGVRSLALFEAKCDLSDDFLIRQLYYPFRLWQKQITKPVRSLFLIYSNGIYRLHEYAFQDINDYNSLVLISQKNYSIEDTAIEIADIQNVLKQTKPVQESNIQFPQADSFERVINICELLYEQELSRNNVTEQYAFDVRQTNYYTDAARYLGLLEKKKDGSTPIYMLSETGRNILNLNFKQRQLAYCERILSHKAFSDTLQIYFEKGIMPSKETVIEIMKHSNIYNVGSDSTFERRSSTVKSWLNWIVGLINN